MNALSPPLTVMTTRPSPTIAAALRRRELLQKLEEDRGDLVEVAHSLRGLAAQVQSAQGMLARTAGSLTWVAAAGSAVAFGLWLRDPHRLPTGGVALALAALSLHAVQAWLRPAGSRGVRQHRRLVGPVSPVQPPPR